MTDNWRAIQCELLDAITAQTRSGLPPVHAISFGENPVTVSLYMDVVADGQRWAQRLGATYRNVRETTLRNKPALYFSAHAKMLGHFTYISAIESVAQSEAVAP